MKEQQQNAGNKKKVTSILSALMVVALLLGGTYAWYDFTQEKDNVFKGDIDRTNYEVELGDDFDPDTWPDQEGEKHDKKIYATNKGDAPLYVRIRLDELLMLDDEIGTTQDYLTHLWTETASAEEDVFHQYFKWFMGTDVKTIAEWKEDGKGNGAFWLLDEDGWCYWGESLGADEETSKLMEQVQLVKKYDGAYEYHINAILQAVSDDDLDKWLDGCEEDGKIFEPCTSAAKELLIGNPVVNAVKDKKPGEKVTIDGYEWWVLSNDGEEAELLTTEIALTYKYGGESNVAWDTSDMRTFLNGTFLESLSSDFQSAIKTVTKLTEKFQDGPLTLETEDNVYLLSKPEVLEYTEILGNEVFKNKSNTETNPIDGSAEQGVGNNNPEGTHKVCDCVYWLLRSRGSSLNTLYSMNGASGSIHTYHLYNASSAHGVRPALTIALN